MIQVKDVVKFYGKHEVLKSVSVDLKGGRIISILGPNASGKTTLIKCILGMVIPSDGMILYNNNEIKGEWKYKKDINYLPQIAQFPENLSVSELIRFIESIRGSSHRKDELINLFELKEHLNEKVSVLSGGTKQKINILLAFMYDNPVYILDEPTNGLDPLALVRLKKLIEDEKNKGKCIIITTHIMQLVEDLACTIHELNEFFRLVQTI